MECEIEIGEAKIEARWFGSADPQAPILVMLHEGLGSLSTWRDFPQQLADATGLRVFAYSRQGHGRSSSMSAPRGPDALHREALDVLPKILEEIGFRKGMLLGHSDGGSIVSIYAGHVHHQGVEGIILIEPHFNVEQKNIDAIRTMAETFHTTDMRERLARHHTDVDAMFSAWNGMWLHPQFEKFDITADLRTIRVPMLFVKGEDDPYSTELQLDLARAHCPTQVDSVIIKGSGHFPYRNDPKATIDAIAAFSRKIFG